MNLSDPKYSKYLLVQEMMQTVDVIKNFDPNRTLAVAEKINSVGKLFLTGEGSSRILPAKNAIRKALRWGIDVPVITEGSHQAMQYDLSGYVVFCASNSGRTKEVVMLAKKIADSGNQQLYAITANKDTLLEKECKQTFVLHCGWEKAVAATKSVIEQTLFYESIIWHLKGMDITPECAKLPSLIDEALTTRISTDIIATCVKAPTIYFAGYNDGVAEELTLKTNEITRKKSDYLEGTYVVHGIEEIMDKNDIVILVDPIEEEMEKYHDVLVNGVGLTVVAIADRDTPFQTIRVPSAGIMNPYVFLCAGWNLLVEIGLALGIDLDKTERARKVGNEFIDLGNR